MYNVTARGLFGANLDEVSALGAVEEIAFDFEGAERLDSPDDLAAPDSVGEGSGAYAPATGIAAITDALAAGLGGRFRPGHRVTAVAGSEAEGFTVRALSDRDR